MDEELFPFLLDGTPANGPGGYTSQSIRNAWRKRVQEGLPWGRLAVMPILPKLSNARSPWRFAMPCSPTN